MCGSSTTLSRKGKNTVVVLVRILPHNSIYTVGSKVSYLDHLCLLCGPWKAWKVEKCENKEVIFLIYASCQVYTGFRLIELWLRASAMLCCNNNFFIHKKLIFFLFFSPTLKTIYSIQKYR